MIKRNILCVFLSIIAVINLYFIVLQFFSFRYTNVYSWGYLIILLLFAALPSILSGVCVAISRSAKKYVIALVCVLIVFSIPVSMWSMFFWKFCPPLYSQTDDINNYLKTDKYVEECSPLGIFPDEIPASARNTEYFYRYRHMVEADYDIYLKLNLSKSDFDAERNRIKAEYPDAEIVDMKNSTEEYRVVYEHNMSYSYKLAIFNESDYSVVYTVSYSLEGDTVGDVPYFKEANISDTENL